MDAHRRQLDGLLKLTSHINQLRPVAGTSLATRGYRLANVALAGRRITSGNLLPAEMVTAHHRATTERLRSSDGFLGAMTLLALGCEDDAARTARVATTVGQSRGKSVAIDFYSSVQTEPTRQLLLSRLTSQTGHTLARGVGVALTSPDGVTRSTTTFYGLSAGLMDDRCGRIGYQVTVQPWTSAVLSPVSSDPWLDRVEFAHPVDKVDPYDDPEGIEGAYVPSAEDLASFCLNAAKLVSAALAAPSDVRAIQSPFDAQVISMLQ